MIGGRGNDSYYVDNSGDVIVEYGAGGTETVYSSVTYRLPDNVERLILNLLEDKDGYGNSLNNFINGNCFDNYLDGEAGNDTIYGSWGNDTLDGDIGADSMLGGPGDDTYYIDDPGDIILEYSNDGVDNVISTISYTLPTNVDNLLLLGTEDLSGIGNNISNGIIGNDGNNILKGWGGNDILYGGVGTDYMYGGIGNDTYYVDNQGDTVFEYSNQGNDTVMSTISYTLPSNLENLMLLGSDSINGTGNALDNYIAGNEGNNVLTGIAGNDTFDGCGGNDTLIGGTGIDTFIFNKGYGNDIIQDSESIDSLQFGDKIALTDLGIFKDGNDLNVSLKTSSDTLVIQNWFLSDQNKIESINFQNGTILTAAGIENVMNHQYGLPLDGNTDTMTGTSVNDVYYVDNIKDIVKENSYAGLDEVRSVISYVLPSNVENLTLLGIDNINGTGNSLSNYIIGNAGNNLLSGGSGNDSLDGGSGIDSMIGGTGNDTYYVDNPEDVVTEYAYQGTDTVFSTITYALPNFVEKLNLLDSENIDGYGNTMANTMYGNTGNNYLAGGSGVDTLYGGAGNDTLDGGIGTDRMYGGTGDDVYFVDNTGDIVTEYSNQGTDEIRSAISYTLKSNFENLTLLGTNNLNGTGNGLNNVITGNSGNNYLSGVSGNDTLIGGDGNDTIDGSYGCDILTGGSGNDLLRGGGNEDTYAGYDARGFGFDTIYDASGIEDRLELGSYDSSIPDITALDVDHNGRVDGLLIDFGNQDLIQINSYFSNTKADPHLSSAGYGLLETIHFSNGDYHFLDIQSLIS
jgi:Ca2+-binding RTX toxin-like protein